MNNGIDLEVQVAKLLIREEENTHAINNSKLGSKLSKTRSNLLKSLKEVIKTDNSELMIKVEKSILQNDLERYSNSASMESSLKTALLEMGIIQKHLAIVGDADKYKAVNEAYEHPKNRQKGLPIDEARQGFKSHFARLVNMDKSRLSDEEKRIIDLRKTMLSTAQKLYIASQAKTLGIELNQNRHQKR